MAFPEDFKGDELVFKVATYVESFMSKFDASHDWHHILRVVSLSRAIFNISSPKSDNGKISCLRKIILAALLHDVADSKYLRPDEDGSRIVADLLVNYGTDEKLASDIQAICHGVSYRAEVNDPAKAQALLEEHPELAVVQDADRLDAIGAIGIGRCFTYGGAKTSRSLDASVHHFDEKLFHLEAMMKTPAGREMAKERTERLRVFKQWWDDESNMTTS
ncbi:hypothetical protein H9L39_17414 [Fusarium oxysporum f. sp. albedinis]|nr:hypothetical protein H9L39_17414 [Fusarium oxysporum f. sp. albedinis]